MSLTCRLLILLCVFTSPLVAAADPAPKKILILGDSLSAGYGVAQGKGWVALLQQQQPQWQIINSSVSGDTTGNGLARLPTAIQAHQPDTVIIELGGNDGLRGTPPKVIRENLLKLVKIAAPGERRVLLMEIRLPPNFGEAYVQSFMANYASVAKETGATLVPFFLRDVALKKDLMQADGIHPNEKGQPLLLQRVLLVLK